MFEENRIFTEILHPYPSYRQLLVFNLYDLKKYLYSYVFKTNYKSKIISPLT